jgi:hypothetical protein
MSRLIPAAERVIRARKLIQKARDLPLPQDKGGEYFSYVAQVKDLLRQSHDLLKLIPYNPSASPELKDEVAAIFKEAQQAEKEIMDRQKLL